MCKFLSVLLDFNGKFDYFAEFQFMIIPFIIFSAFVIMFILCNILTNIFSRRHINKNNKGIGTVIDKTIDQANQKLEDKTESNKPSFCEYCGSLISKDTNECSSCGARKKIK